MNELLKPHAAQCITDEIMRMCRAMALEETARRIIDNYDDKDESLPTVAARLFAEKRLKKTIEMMLLS